MDRYDQFISGKKDIYEKFVLELDRLWPVESRDYYIKTSFGSTFVREIGRGEPLVLLPGLGCNSIAYKEMVEKLSRSFKLFIIDIIGNFGSSYLSRELTSTDDYIDWQDEVYKTLGIEDSFSIMGFSMGAWLGALYSKGRKGVKNLIMISPVAVVAPISLKVSISGIVPMIIPSLKKYFLKKDFKDFYQTHDSADEIFNREIYGPVSVSNTCFKKSRPLIPLMFTSEEAESVIAKILYLIGANERMCKPDKGVANFESLFKNGLSKIVPDTGHDLIAVKPDYIVKEVTDFIK